MTELPSAATSTSVVPWSTEPAPPPRTLGKTTVMLAVLRGVDVTLLYIDDCPSWRLADERLREALARAGRDDVRVERRLVTTAAQAEAAGFRGSPTALIDGRDRSPSRTRRPACRVACSVRRQG